ncbi:hypothetical protein BST81_05630 [Leptolyngbya sp. 'hensonii']|uniref:FecR family protein n=1 Tax=Leptolyngbya sp. 'hensonii' TaxID=1922337 RepID=UPI00094FB96D|nr:FecR family protein [Leptolyngbya sp. 'hensonii']OLP19242.1 hypothetical protein BST81_05630 [Leptolyngbya sp. 'hensonii']
MLIAIGSLMASCGAAISEGEVSQSPSSAVSSPQPLAKVDPTAQITEIQKQPVLVRQLQAKEEIAGREGMGLQMGETIRTQGEAMAEITLQNGLGFRLARNSVLTINPQNELNLTSGDMLTWVPPGRKIPATIVTPTAIAGIRGTTVFVSVPKDGKTPATFFSWEGTVAVRVKGHNEEMLLRTGEEVKIGPGDRDIAKLRRKIRRFSRREFLRRRKESVMMNQFRKPIATHKVIEAAIPGRNPSP